jgi:PIN domain nuclease of toxin-antitoxin system
MVVLDTSALLFWTLDPGQLSPTAEREIEDAERVLIS